MLQGVRDHEETLRQSERFYYNNYEYYNDYEDLNNKYKNDLSKLRFNLHRKSKARIVLYDTVSSHYNEPPHERLIKEHLPKYCPHELLINNHLDFKTLDDLLYRFVQTYHEHNYADIKLDREDAKDQFQVIIFKFMDKALEHTFSSREDQDFKTLSEILQKLKQKGNEVIQYLQLLFQREGRLQSDEFLQRWYAFEHYWCYLLQTKLQANTKNQKIENFYLFEFCLYFRHLLDQVTNCNYRNLLLLAQPFTPLLSTLVHPLVIPLTFALTNGPSPRILILNLDGKDTYYNLRAVGNLPKSVRYISVFRQPAGRQLSSFKMQSNCQQFTVNVDYKNMVRAHSELIFREVYPRDLQGGWIDPNQNIILYPLNSLYLRRCYSNYKLNQGYRSIEDRTLPHLQSSEDIYWLWQQLIAAKVQQWSPELVIVSYNGDLDIKQHHFNEIIKDLTVQADHRVVLFTNMTALFQTAPELEQQQMEQEQWSTQRIDVIQQFMSKYVPYSYEKIDEERYFNNLSSFIKISSGACSLQPNNPSNSLSRYCLGRRLQYIERLSELPQFQNTFASLANGSSLHNLFSNFGRRQLLQNRKENEAWQKKIEEVEKQLLEISLDTLSFDMANQKKWKEILFRIQAVKQELQIEAQQVHESATDVGAEFSEYLRQGKERLLLSNLESYRYRKAYISEQEQRGGGRIRCLRLCLNDEQIRLQRYSQVIMNEKRTQVFVINYRVGEQGHVMLSGQVQDKDGLVRMSRVNAKLQQTMSHLNLENRSQIVRLNYSHCFIRNKLYLFWPQEWDVREEIRRRLLALDYNPPHVNYMLRLQFNEQEKTYILQNLKYKTDGGPLVVPRRGCVCLEAPNNSFYILGGIYDSRLDFYTHAPPVSTAIIDQDYFKIQAPQKHNKNHIARLVSLKPKMHYRIERSYRSSQQGGSVLLSGGYGRSFTNFHSLFSYETYSASIQQQGLKITKLQMKNSRLVKLQKPTAIPVIGRYMVGGYGQAQERFSQQVKDWIVAEGREQANGERAVLSVLQDQLRVRQFKSNYKRQYLFGWDRTIRERIYLPHCWSPELQIVTGGRLYLVNTALKIDKSSHYNAGPFIIPKQDDLISMCLQEDNLLLLCISVLQSMQNSSIVYSSKTSSYCLYQGSLESIGDLFVRRQLPMLERKEWKSNKGHDLQQNLLFKTIFALDDKIYLLGGLSKSGSPGIREQFVLERSKDKLKGRTRRLQCAQDDLQLPSPVVVKHKDGFLLYSIVAEKKQMQRDNFVTVQDYWLLKIETFTPNQTTPQEKLRVGPLSLYYYDYQLGVLQREKPTFNRARIVKILPYTPFSFSQLRNTLQKVYLKISRKEDQKCIQYSHFLLNLITERDEARLSQALIQHHHRGKTFKELLTEFNQLLDEQKRQRENLQNQQFIKDLRNLYSLLNKHLFQAILQPQIESNLYRFLFDNGQSRKVKYMAIGGLLTTQLRFLRIRYQHELSVCLNESTEEQVFLNTNVMCCEEIVREPVRARKLQVEEEQQELIRKVHVTYTA